jgi:hypothetical protein
MADEGNRRGGIPERRWFGFADGYRRGPRRARFAQQARQGAEWLAVGPGRIEEAGAIEMIVDVGQSVLLSSLYTTEWQ